MRNMMFKLRTNSIFLIYFLLLASLQSCGNNSRDLSSYLPINQDTFKVEYLGIISGTEILVSKDIDMKGSVCYIPENMTLNFKGGMIKNGKLIGKGTKIIYKGKIFENISISGSWQVPEIKTSMFSSLSQVNDLKNVFALANPSCKNVIKISQGTYYVRAEKNGDVCLRTCDNSDIVFDGVIKMTPNNYTNYYILQAEGKNVTIRGKGAIIGDKHTHIGKEGEWGMGINIVKGYNIKIEGLTIKDCWGDCIYIGCRSTDVTIKNCNLDHGRRQGISITSGKNIKISKCSINHVAGTPPEYAIDIEPNEGDTVTNVLMERITVDKCVGGIMTTVFGWDPSSKVGNVIVKNCSFSTTGDEPLRITRCDSAFVENCKINASNKTAMINVFKVRYAILEKNNFIISKKTLYNIKNKVRTYTGGLEYNAIKKNQCDVFIERGNRVFYR